MASPDDEFDWASRRAFAVDNEIAANNAEERRLLLRVEELRERNVGLSHDSKVLHARLDELRKEQADGKL